MIMKKPSTPLIWQQWQSNDSMEISYCPHCDTRMTLNDDGDRHTEFECWNWDCPYLRRHGQAYTVVYANWEDGEK
jgi:hypothetical protein